MANNIGGPKEFSRTEAPSASRGEMKSISVDRATFRQRLDDSAAAQGLRLIGNIGAKLSGAASVVLGTMGMTGAANAVNQLGGVANQMAQTGGSATPAMMTADVHGLSTTFSAQAAAQQQGGGGGQLAATASNQTASPFGAGASMRMGPQTSNQGTAFGAGAGALPGAEMTVGVGASSGGGGIGGAQGGGAIGAAAGGGGQDQLLNATKQMQETQMSFNLQYLQLQSQMQHENRSYTAISNIMKTKHDTVKNSISNVR
ncbi:MAG: hypothetical protein IT381_23445 [Deltaproteobacteria bacterium]|nr:hypothetical protein [Deltaproteobacteria bacterium]